jgi:hypothetical protein
MSKLHPIAQVGLVFAVLLLMAYIPVCDADDVKVCTDRSSYPTKVVVVCSTCQCPAGYY